VLDLAQKQVIDDRGTAYDFGKLLLATGVTPLRLPFGGHRVIYYRTLHDYRRLRQEAAQGRRFAVVGGGFVGSEIASSLIANGNEVVLLFPEAGIGARLFPPELSAYLNALYRLRGVDVRAGTAVADIVERGDRLRVATRHIDSGLTREIEVDGVVAGIGARPNVDLALAAGLPVDDGIVVDEYLRAGHPDVFAAGDVASFWQTALGRRRRVEHEDNARVMGRVAGRAMTGELAPYDHLPSFYSDLFDLGYEAVGEVDARHEAVAEWEEPFRVGVVSYHGGGRVRGVLLWNVWGQLDAARARIGQPIPAAGLAADRAAD
jgi:NADPH-dependent 2,4-dienoyl-CoA reductase/sulfur reductase-like enzyme